MDTDTTQSTQEPFCWFCEQEVYERCKCGRDYCREHMFSNRCLICALGIGLFEQAGEDESVSGLMVLGLSAAAGDPYIVVPPRLMGVQPLPMSGVGRMLGAVVRMTGSKDPSVRHRSAVALAKTTNSWPTMDPSQVSRHNFGTGLISLNVVRSALLEVLKQSRMTVGEPTSVAVWEKLRTADFRDLYPGILDGLSNYKYVNVGTRVHEMFAGLDEVYPTNSYAINEQCELFVYDQYTNKQRGAGALMERMYGPKLRYAPILARMLKKGVWHSSYTRFNEWYPGEDEPY
jgi:hypothetical protein